MICSMQWREENTVLDVAEVNTDNKVGISMFDPENENYGQFIYLEKHDVVRLRDWLNEAIKDFEG